ncbi:LysR family transcriptional regulator [Bradyrhizobium sp. CCBAU 25338]|uniref:LysR family transcriptional regulator n=1 Tax=Bradyrhizobium sp. CCBAU 25338 TaxID=1641877 RepID=UPI002304AD7A|nr:LysR family transcriptional regulator [Bradyrhizobium sp. CCBAU 25338]MDA9529049.1 LysR family transcriptional regulator [Bradyrhizobium sp. CCBAU 25338]
MSIRTESVGAMSAFVQAAELRSFKLAGQQFGLSSSAIGKTIAKLEDQLGVRLFHRSTRAIALTQEGEIFLDRCRRVLSELEAAEAELAQTTASPRGRLRVGVPFAGDLLTPLFGEFSARFPDIELDLDYNDRLVDVIEDGFDAVIRTGEVSDSRLMHVKLGDFSSRLVASPGYLAKAGVPRKASDLIKHRLLHHRIYETGKLVDWDLTLPEGTALPVALATTSLEPLIRLAEAGYGVASVPYFAVADLMTAGTLREVLPGAKKKNRALRLLWPRSNFPLPKVSAFVKFMTESLRSSLSEVAK